MRISAPLATLPQPSLFPEMDDRPMTSPALARWYAGMWFQEATRVLTGAVPHVTDGGADVCPDLSHPGAGFLEVKGLRNESIVYQHRLRNDARLVGNSGRTLTYVYWSHSAPVMSACSLFELRAMLASGVTSVLAVPFERIRRAVHRLPTTDLAYKATGERMPAYRMCNGLVREMAKGPTTLLRSFTVFGSPVTVSVHGPDLGRLFAPLTTAQRAAASELRAELSEHTLDVALVPARRQAFDGHCIRVCMDENPSWYSRLCAAYSAKRSRPRRRAKPDTDIRRRFVERSLDRLAMGVCRYEYDWRLRPIVERAAHG